MLFPFAPVARMQKLKANYAHIHRSHVFLIFLFRPFCLPRGELERWPDYTPFYSIWVTAASVHSVRRRPAHPNALWRPAVCVQVRYGNPVAPFPSQSGPTNPGGCLILAWRSFGDRPLVVARSLRSNKQQGEPSGESFSGTKESVGAQVTVITARQPKPPPGKRKCRRFGRK